ncbi:MAG: hypothetical protein GXO21_05350 [Aquificae bacterium]|nr:hypothetical protein [Aquificota bacterium]
MRYVEIPHEILVECYRKGNGNDVIFKACIDNYVKEQETIFDKIDKYVADYSIDIPVILEDPLEPFKKLLAYAIILGVIILLLTKK